MKKVHCVEFLDPTRRALEVRCGKYANIQKMPEHPTDLFYIYALTLLAFAAGGTIKQRHVRAVYRQAAVGTSLIIMWVS